MVRKLVLAVAAASALMSSNMVQALGIGEINLRSALNQPLDAEIELLQVRDLSSSEIRSVLASPDDFGKAGIDRSFFLTDLTFTPVVRQDGKAVIRVTSTRPVKEPYLNFLMEVRWPSGRVLREFTLLLDPPLYQPAPVAASAPIARPAPSASGNIVRPAPARPAAQSSATPGSSGAASGEWKTTRADTLWDIALKNRPQGASVHQTMLAIQDLNPTAFIGDNINSLRADQTLTLPNAEQAATRSRADAVAQVASQTTAWQNRRPATKPAPRQLDARERDVAGAAPAQARNEDSLRLLSGTDEASETNTDSAADGENGGLRDALDRTKEQLDSTEREKDELNDRLADIQGQLETLQRLLELKDAQLAALQSELNGDDELPDILPVPEENAQVDTTLVDTTALADEPVEADLPLEQEAAAESGAESGEAEEDAGDTSTDEEQIAVAPLAVPAEQSPAEPDSTAALVQPAPVAPTGEEARMDSKSPEALLQRFMQNQSLLLGAGVVALLLLLLILMAIARRNARREAELADNFIAQTAVSGEDDSSESDNDDFNVALADAQADSQEDMGIAEDPLIEADALIAYGKLDQAADALQSAIYEEPERTDLRLKMMEVEALRENPQGYSAQAEALRRMGVADAAVEMMNARYPLMAAGLMTGAALMDDGSEADVEELSLEESLEDAPVIDNEGEGEGGAIALDSDADQFDFSDFGLEEDAAASLADSADEQGAGFDLDFDLDEELSDPASANADTDMFDSAADVVEPVDAQGVSPAPSNDDFELNLDDELQADNLLAEFEATNLAGSEVTQDDAQTPAADDSFTLTDDDLAGFEAELQSVMHAEEGAGDNSADQASAEIESDAAPDVTLDEDPMPSDNLDDDDFDFLSDTDECATKLDLARAYIDMGDEEGARDILAEVVEEGNEQQQQDAREMIGQIG
ncbi:pilus assembly protein FimV [Halopseudomonas litoralis]|uniref:Pilus assembly protein FimV n=1 Tax=Halopseudomonas litoralis TaxID=797277 RepID=A0A1H1RZL8_9GAMM|nr:FimV/HubP family polar landmark protein [Halopseudomonas litoralis]SDS41103.1 pilus assembly protein FimV [Halopseudomonas litoralis]